MDSVEKKLRKGIKQLEEEIEKLRVELVERKECLADLMCPLEVGDFVKDENGTFVVDRISIGRGFGQHPDYSLWGKKIKKSGNPGIVRREIARWTIPTKVRKLPLDLE